MTKARDFRELGDEELFDRLNESKTELFNLRFRSATGQLDNSARMGDVRKDIARMNTLIREREIDAAESSEEVNS